MFLDTFVCTSESSIPDLNDLQLECAVSLEAAYNDMVLESCQLKYQAMVEGVSVIHEGVIESIKNFFKAIFRAISTEEEPLSAKLNLLRPAGTYFTNSSHSLIAGSWVKLTKITCSN